MTYTVKNSIRGKRKVSFQCPICGTEIESPLEEAGKRYPCLSCKREIVIPGTADLLAIRDAERKKVEEKAALDQEAAAKEATRQEEKAARLRESQQQRLSKKANASTRDRTRYSAATVLAAGVASTSLACLIVYLGMVRPLQLRLARSEQAISALTAEGMDSRRTAATLASLVGKNSEIANANIESLRSVVTGNADVANSNARKLSDTLESLASLVAKNSENANTNLESLRSIVSDNADIANANSRRLSDALESLTRTVNYNADTANRNAAVR